MYFCRKDKNQLKNESKNENERYFPFIDNCNTFYNTKFPKIYVYSYICFFIRKFFIRK